MNSTTLEPSTVWTPWCGQPEDWAYVIHLFMLVFAIFNMVLMIYGLYKIRHESTKLPIKILFVIIYWVFGTSGIVYCIQLICGYFFCVGFEVWISIGHYALAAYFYGLSFLYLLYLTRLWMLFRGNTIGRLSTVAFIFGMFGFIIQFMMPIFATYYLDTRETWPTGLVFLNIFTYANIIFSLYLLYLFWIKIMVLGRGQETQNILLDLALRYAFCAFCSVISSLIYNVVIIVRISVEDSAVSWTMSYLLVVMDQSVNMIMLYLQFSFGKTLYYKYGCHKLVSQVCAKCNRPIEKNGKLESSENAEQERLKIDNAKDGGITMSITQMETNNNTNTNIELIAKVNKKWDEEEVNFDKLTMDSSTKMSKDKSSTGTASTMSSNIDFSTTLYMAQ